VPARRVKYRVVLFDLLTALLDSWSVRDAAAGSVEMGLAPPDLPRSLGESRTLRTLLDVVFG
jgi:hypothetical protein